MKCCEHISDEIRPKRNYDEIPLMSKKLKIVILADVPMWVFPGLESLKEERHYATWLEAAIPEYGNFDDLEITWVSVSKKIKKKTSFKLFSQTFILLPRWKKILSIGTFYKNDEIRINKIIKSVKPDIVHCWGSEDAYGLVGARLQSESKLFTLQGCLNDYLKKMGGGILFRIQAFYEKKLIKRYHYSSAESPLAREQLLELNSHLECTLVDYPVRDLFFNAKWNPLDVPVFVYVGAITERKGVRDLVEVFRDARFKKTKLLMIGGGDLLKELSKISTPNVEWLGNLSSKEVCQSMERAWALLMPTYADTGPTVVKEARVIGLPVLLTNNAGCSSYIKEYGGGEIIKAKNIDSWKDAVERLSKSKKEVLKLGFENHAQIKNELHPSRTITKFRALYRKIYEDSMQHKSETFNT